MSSGTRDTHPVSLYVSQHEFLSSSSFHVFICYTTHTTQAIWYPHLTFTRFWSVEVFWSGNFKKRADQRINNYKFFISTVGKQISISYIQFKRLSLKLQSNYDPPVFCIIMHNDVSFPDFVRIELELEWLSFTRVTKYISLLHYLSEGNPKVTVRQCNEFRRVFRKYTSYFGTPLDFYWQNSGTMSIFRK